MRCKPRPGPREGLNPLAAFERHLEPLCSRYCGPSALSCTEVSDEPVSRSIESRSSEEASQGTDPPLSQPRSGRDGAVSRTRCRQPPAGATTRFRRCGLRLHDAQSCIAREHGFVSWPDLKRYVEVQIGRAEASARRASCTGRSSSIPAMSAARPIAPIRASRCGCWLMIPNSIAGDPWLACAIGDEGALRQATQADPSWVNRPGGPLRLPPLFAVAHSSLLRVPEFRERLHRMRAVADRGRRRRQPAHPQPLAAGIARASRTSAVRSRRSMAPPAAITILP